MQRPVRNTESNVDLPAPDGPRTAVSVDASKQQEMLFRIGFRYDLHHCLPRSRTLYDTDLAASVAPPEVSASPFVAAASSRSEARICMWRAKEMERALHTTTCLWPVCRRSCRVVGEEPTKGVSGSLRSQPPSLLCLLLVFGAAVMYAPMAHTPLTAGKDHGRDVEHGAGTGPNNAVAAMEASGDRISHKVFGLVT